MCGFSGILFSTESSRDNHTPGVSGFRRAANRIAHRGDTDHRELRLPKIWLSHYRLAFQDVASGTQPMLSADGRHVIVFNGEVYNHLTLRDDIVRGASELDLVRSGLDDTLRTAFRDMREAIKHNENIHDFRTAAYAVAITKIAQSYYDLGLANPVVKS